MSQLSNRIAEAIINYANAFKETPDNPFKNPTVN